MKPSVMIMSIAAAVLLIGGCDSPARQFTEKKLVIASKETVRIAELDLTITNNGCGRKWISEENKPAIERPFCDLEIRSQNSTIHAGGDFKPVYIGNIEITIDKMNPWGREEDSVPPGGCRVWIRRTEGR